MKLAMEAHAFLHVYEYMGFAVNIPTQFINGYIAMDETGEVYVYDARPGVGKDDEYNDIYIPLNNGKCCKILDLLGFTDAQDMTECCETSLAKLWSESCWPISELPKLR